MSTTHDFHLADIGEGLDQAEIVAWRVAVGDAVTRDQPLVEILTDKSHADLPAPVSGTIVELIGDVGDIIEVGAMLARISPSTDGSPTPPPATFTVAATAIDDTAPPALGETAESGPVALSRVKASPSTRRAAANRGIDLTTITGSGPGGRILLADLQPHHDGPAVEHSSVPSGQTAVPDLVERNMSAAPVSDSSLAASPAAPHPATASSNDASPNEASPNDAASPTSPPAHPLPEAGTWPLRGIRRAVARNMSDSWTEIPHIHTFLEIDAQPLLTLREELRHLPGGAFAGLTPLSFFVAAVADALRCFPAANSSIDIDNQTLTVHDQVNVGVAVASDHGLLVPVVSAADQLRFTKLVTTLADLVSAARSGALDAASTRSGTSTITNFGSLGGEQATPLVRPPEATIFGFGSIAIRPFVVDGAVVARPTMHLVLGADHRLLDGDVVSACLNHVGELLIQPLRLVLQD